MDQGRRFQQLACLRRVALPLPNNLGEAVDLEKMVDPLDAVPLIVAHGPGQGTVVLGHGIRRGELLGGKGVETAIQDGAVVQAAVLAHSALIVEAAFLNHPAGALVVRRMTY